MKGMLPGGVVLGQLAAAQQVERHDAHDGDGRGGDPFLVGPVGCPGAAQQ